MKVLIVDDQVANLKLLRVQLEAEGMAVHEARDGVEALAVLKREPVDAIVADILMPHMDGYRLCSEVRRSKQWRDLPLIFYTATYASPSDEKLAMALGADKFLRKPATAAAMVEALREVCSPGVVRARPASEPLADKEVMKKYNERLVAKLEQKNTELAAALALLQTKEERLRSIVQTEPECVKVVSPEGRLLEMNPAGLAMLEADTLDQVSQQPLLNFLVPEHRAAFADLHRRVMEGKDATLQFEVTGLKGGRRWLETHATPLHNNQGRIDSLLGITRDITHAKRSETALQESEQRLRNILDTMFVFVGLLDLDGRIVEVNRAPLAAAALKREDVLGRTVAESYWFSHSPAMQAQVHQALARAAQGEVAREDYSIRIAEGRLITIDCTFAPLRDAAGRVVQIVGSANDITGRKKDEALLNGQKEVLELIAKGAPLPETLTTLVRLIEAQSPEMLCTVLLLDADGVHVRHGAAPSLPADFARAVDGAAIGPAAGSCGTAAFRRETVIVEDIATDPLWAEWRALALPHGLRACWSTPIFDAARHVLGTFAIYYRQPGRPSAQDQRLVEIATHTAAIAIERHRSEAGLTRQHILLTAVLEGTNDAIFAKDLSGRYLLANTACRRAMGVPLAEIIGRTDEELVPPEIMRRYQETDAHVSATGDLLTFEESRLMPDGLHHWLTSKTQLREADGRVVGVIGVARDITQRKQVEEAWRASEERFRQVVENINEVFWMTDAEKNQMLYISPAYEKIWGRTCESIYQSPRNWVEAIYPEDREAVVAAMLTKQIRGEYDETFRITRPDGSLRWIRAGPSRSRRRMAGCGASSARRRTSPSTASWRRSSSRRRSWRPSAPWPEASPMISTTSWAASWATPSWPE